MGLGETFHEKNIFPPFSPSARVVLGMFALVWGAGLGS